MFCKGIQSKRKAWNGRQTRFYTFYLYSESESESETLNEEDFNFLISHLKKTDEGFIQYKDFAEMLSKKN